MMRSVSQPAQFPAGSCGAVGEVSLSDKGSYLLPTTIFGKNWERAALLEFAHGRELSGAAVGLDELLTSKIQLARPGRGELLEAGDVSNFDSSKTFFICHHRPLGNTE